jgi:hypothetical protein
LSLCSHEVDFGIAVEWNFCVKSHYKDPYYGVARTVKEVAACGSLQQPYNVYIMIPGVWTTLYSLWYEGKEEENLLQ